MENKIIVNSLSELPIIPDNATIYLDVETNNSFADTNPIHPAYGVKICGIAITYNVESRAWYIPIRHKRGNNLEIAGVKKWLADTIKRSKSWVNHNINFDARFIVWELDDFNALNHIELIDTLTMSKLYSSERLYGGGGYSLDAVVNDWCGYDITGYEKELKGFLSSIPKKENRSYAAIPIETLGEYACVDVLSNRDLYHTILAKQYESKVWELEKNLTKVIFDIEKTGLRIDVTECQKRKYLGILEKASLEDALYQDLKFSINPDSVKDCYRVLVEYLNLPVIAKTEKGSPQFDNAVLQSYSNLEVISKDPRKSRIVRNLQSYRTLTTRMGLYIEPYMQYQVHGIIYPTINQIVRTGRMSGKEPNMMQLNKWAKELILPRYEGQNLYSLDYSQIEFRLIANYIENEKIIKAYQQDKSTDFHDWVAKQAGITRRQGKTVNFAIAFGAGKNKIQEQLAQSPELMEDIIHEVEAEIRENKIDADSRELVIEARCKRKAKEIYDRYNEELPQLGRIRRSATRACEKNGFVKDIIGRRRHLGKKFAFKAFNAAIQGSAASIMKMAAVNLHKNLEGGNKLLALVHDEFLISGNFDETNLQKIKSVLTDTSEIDLETPLDISLEMSTENWGSTKEL